MPVMSLWNMKKMRLEDYPTSQIIKTAVVADVEIIVRPVINNLDGSS